MKPEILYQYLENRAQEIVPAPSNLWPRIQDQLQEKRPVAAQSRMLTLKQSSFLIAGVIVISLAVFFFGTAQGKALTQSIIHFFIPAAQTVYPISAANQTQAAVQQATANVELTEWSARILALRTELAITPTPVPTLIPATTSTNQSTSGVCSSPENSSTFMCQLLDAQAKLGFPVKVLPALAYPQTMLFENLAIYPKDNETVLYLGYWNPGISIVRLFQGQGDFPSAEYQAGDYPAWGMAPTEAIQHVYVGSYPAELVMGDFFPDGAEVRWDPSPYSLRLRWEENDKWYELFVILTGQIQIGVTHVSEEAAIELASKLVPISTGSRIVAGAPGSIAMVEKEAGVTILKPGYLPSGYVFRYAQYDPAAGRVMLLYTLFDPGSAYEKYLAIFEMQASGANRQFPAVYQFPADIGGIPGE